MISKSGIIQALMGSIALLATLPAFALQTIAVINNASVSAAISDKDFNKVLVQGDRIQNVIGTPNAYIIQTDNILGQIYIRPLQTQPFVLNISTEQGNAYQVILHVTHGAPDTVQLQPPVVTPAQAADWESATPYEDTLIRLIRDMATGGFPEYLKSERIELLHQLLDDLLLRDIAVRFGVRDVKSLQNLAI
ncbi:MAG: type-F conjugative transfer system secretin TraK, partial [Gammaproteobacteria bacterium]